MIENSTNKNDFSLTVLNYYFFLNIFKLNLLFQINLSCLTLQNCISSIKLIKYELL